MGEGLVRVCLWAGSVIFWFSIGGAECNVFFSISCLKQTILLPSWVFRAPSLRKFGWVAVLVKSVKWLANNNLVGEARVSDISQALAPSASELGPLEPRLSAL